jgi:hypothetical protein
MKLIIRKLWFRHNIEDTVKGLFRIPQLKEQFDESYIYDGEMRPRGLKIFPCYWQADGILARLPESKKHVYLVLTSMDLKGDYGRINGKGYDMKAIASNDSFIDGHGSFDYKNPRFFAMAFGEIGHALGLMHHEHNSQNPCEMSHNYIPNTKWKSIEEIRFCNDCYDKLKQM